MKLPSLLLCCIAAVSLLNAQTSQNPSPGRQPERRVKQFKTGDVVFLQEIGAIVTAEKGLISVVAVPPNNKRAGVPEVDIAAGDEVGMFAGKRIKSIAELKTAYDSTRPGQMVKLGLRRDGQPHIITFERKSQKDMPQNGNVVIRREGSAPNAGSDILPALGIGIQKRGASVIISETMTNAPKGMQKDDVIVNLNGTKISSIAEFNSAFDATAIGAPLRFELLRNGQPVHISAPRPKPIQIIRREK
jgi:S1-C subfamily serine protease